MLNLKINVNLSLLLLCIVISVAHNGKFKTFVAYIFSYISICFKHTKKHAPVARYNNKIRQRAVCPGITECVVIENLATVLFTNLYGFILVVSIHSMRYKR